MTENHELVYRLRNGNVVAAVQVNNSHTGYFYNTTFARLHKEKPPGSFTARGLSMVGHFTLAERIRRDR
jgi:hypothetical protein